MVDGKSTAFLREITGGKARARAGRARRSTGCVVAEVKPDRVRLTLGRREPKS